MARCALTEARRPVDNQRGGDSVRAAAAGWTGRGLDTLDLIREDEYKWSVSRMFALVVVVGWSGRKPCCNV
jgi:hypothetical protein